MYPNTCVVVFAKAPIPGQVNTRLIPAIGPIQAAELAHQWLSEKIKMLAVAALSRVSLYVLSDIHHPVFSELADHFEFELIVQQGADLGERMSNALDDELTNSDSVILIGTDCPDLDATYVENAILALETADCVVGPATDGGYVLIGATRIDPRCFSGVQWGSANVFENTCEKLQECGLSYTILPALKDIDRPEDL